MASRRLILVASLRSATEKMGSLSLSLLVACLCARIFHRRTRMLTQHANEANALLNSLSANICSGRKLERAGNGPHTPCVLKEKASSQCHQWKNLWGFAPVCALKLSHFRAKRFY